MNTSSSVKLESGSFKRVSLKLSPEETIINNQDQLKAAIAFLLLRYTGKEHPELQFEQDGQVFVRRWEIGDKTRMRDLEKQFTDRAATADLESLELSVWNPAFVSCVSEEDVNESIRQMPAGAVIPDLIFIVSHGMDKSLGLWSSHEDHSQDFLKQLLGHWLNGIRLLKKSPWETAAFLPIFDKEEYNRVVLEWNDTDRPTDNGKFDFEEFDVRVEQVPDKIAVSHGNDKLTYRELHQKANRLAHYLQGLGVGPEVVVGIYLPRSIEFVVSLVGLTKSGGTFLPLDPGQPEDRKEFMIQDSGASFIITNRENRESLPAGSFQIVLLEEFETRLGKLPGNTPSHGLKAGNMSYLFYTSGSTGKPKGVMMLHSFQDKKDPSEESAIKDEKVLLKSSTGFTVILIETFSAIKAGGEIVIVPEGREKDTRWLIEKVKEVKIESIHLVPSLLSLLLQDGLEQCISLKKVFTIGERLPVAVQREFFRKLPQAQLFVFYGCTEAPGATFREILPNEGFGDRVILGKPQNNKKIYLLDKYKVPVPIGVPGEIFVGGRISRGYVKNNTLTRERFIPDPFTGKPGDRMYQTGDMGRFLEDGNIEYLGRTDFQVKIRGIRIEPAEVDIRVTEHPSILECVTVAKEDASGDNRLISYYVRNKQAQPLKENELSEFIRKRLPEYMVPAAFVAIDKIPLLFNGKIDRKSLPDLEIVGSRISEAAQGSVLEKQLTDIWEEILDAKQVSRRDNYFELGGNSLKVLRLCQRIKSDLDKTVSVAEVYENPTIQNLAKLLQDEKRGERFSHFFGGASGQTPIFFMPGISRNALIFSPLTEILKQDRPCFGLELPGLENGEEPLETIEEMAVHCIKALKRIQPKGPYFLAGYSFGGLLAFETARQLGEKEGDICRVILFDTRLNKPRTYTISDRIRWSLKRFFEEPVYYPTYIARELFFRLMNLIGLGKFMVKYQGVDEDWGDINAISPGIFNRTYEPKPCDAPVLLFTARDTEFSITSAHDLGNWKNACKREVQTCRINTSYHVHVLKREYLKFIREKMNEFLGEGTER